jgi:hypothetical protein
MRCALDGAVSFMRCTLDGAVSFMLTFDALYSRRRFLPDACSVLATALFPDNRGLLGGWGALVAIGTRRDIF